MKQQKIKVFLAPMAGLTDYSFRRICRENGADLTYTEMVSAKALSYMDLKTAELAKIRKGEEPVAIQIFGSDVKIMAEAASLLSKNEYAHCTSSTLPCCIDVNMGCPVHKVVKNGEGSALLKNPSLAYDLLKNTVEASAIPVTVKIRTGFDSNSKNAVQIAELAEKAGVSAITVHGRTREEMYRPFVDLDTIREVKKAVSIPVIGNGGIFSKDDALKMLEYTSCDALMIARGALGNPFIFRELKSEIEHKPYQPPSEEEKIRMALYHLELLLQEKGQLGLLESRKHLAFYIKGMPGAPKIRNEINQITNPDVMKETLLKLIK